jgi:hypothetical protein
MRATYEELLQVAWQAAIEVRLEEYSDPLTLAAGWRSVLTATRHHLGWLRGRLRTPDPAIDAPAEESSSLTSLAQAIGAGADLLAIHDVRNTVKLAQGRSFAVAQGAVASIVLIGAEAVLRDARKLDQLDGSVGPLRAHLKELIPELEGVSRRERPSGRLGALGSLAAGGPRLGAHGVELVARAATRWQREHEAVEPVSLLTRDLRSMTAQLRTVCGWARLLARHLLIADQHFGLGPTAESELNRVVRDLAEFDAEGARVARCWQSRLSDISGQSVAPGSDAFLELAAVLNQLGRRSGRLLRTEELIPDRRSALSMLAALDELVYSAARAARFQQRTVTEQVRAGALFIPRAVLVRSQPHSWPIGIGSRNRPRLWVTTTRPDCFTELSDAVRAAAGRLLGTSAALRELAGTANHLRPDGEFQSALPAEAFEPRPRHEDVAISIGSLESLREFGGLDR